MHTVVYKIYIYYKRRRIAVVRLAYMYILFSGRAMLALERRWKRRRVGIYACLCVCVQQDGW